jgi:hypothetical protein
MYDHVSLGDVEHFNTPLHVCQFLAKHVNLTSGKKNSSSLKESALIPCKSHGLYSLALKRRIERGEVSMTYSAQVMYLLAMLDTLTRPFTCVNFGQTRVQHREGKTHHR